MKYFLLFLRIVIGLLFIFSGVLKANDPMGLVYKMNEFFDALNMSFMVSGSFIFSVIMIALEIVCGVAVLIGYRFRLFSTLMLLLNIFFLFITAFALFTGKVKECGCFGTCVKISNDATFYKDIVLTAISLVLFLYRKRVSDMFPPKVNAAIFWISVLIACGMEWYTLTYLPAYDCMPFMPGNSILEKSKPGPEYHPAVFESIMIYEKDGVKKEFTMANYPWEDSTWKFVERKDKLITPASGEPEIHDFILNDSAHNDLTESILTAKGYTFLWFIRNLDQPHVKNMDKLASVASAAAAMHIPFYALGASYEDTKTLLKQHNVANTAVLLLDGTASRTAMRTNPGLMLIKDGVVVRKWSYMDYPSHLSMNGDKLEAK